VFGSEVDGGDTVRAERDHRVLFVPGPLWAWAAGTGESCPQADQLVREDLLLSGQRRGVRALIGAVEEVREVGAVGRAEWEVADRVSGRFGEFVGEDRRSPGGCVVGAAAVMAAARMTASEPVTSGTTALNTSGTTFLQARSARASMARPYSLSLAASTTAAGGGVRVAGSGSSRQSQARAAVWIR
jgi:hypothetical protein